MTRSELREIQTKADSLDAAVEWLSGRIDSEKLMNVYDILTGKGKYEKKQDTKD